MGERERSNKYMKKATVQLGACGLRYEQKHETVHCF